jgi:hypothetical protein
MSSPEANALIYYPPSGHRRRGTACAPLEREHLQHLLARMKVGVRSPQISGLIRVVSREPQFTIGALFYAGNSAYLSQIQRADERTRTAFLFQLRAIIYALQGFA